MATTLNARAYDILMDDEKMAIGLQLGMQKSSWESGEIMKKSHYKYLEIRHRAEKFLKMFTDHFTYYDKAIPDFVDGQKYILEYLNLCIEKRLRPYEAVEALKGAPILKKIDKATVNERLIEVITYWKKTANEKPHNGIALNLVMDFDRWNNFRILPKEIQEPSAYKRRQKNAHKKHLKVLTRLPEMSIEQLKKIFLSKRGPHLYWPHIYKKKVEIIKVKNTKGAIETFSSLGLYLFTTKETAEEYITPSASYLINSDRDCRDGLDFWPIYRELIKKAYNYTDVQNIIPERKYLESAISKLEFI